ncbi:MAG: glycoside hydrolase family 172 protein [bacterium]
MFSPLEGIARIRPHRSRRSSTYDTTGGNRDGWQLKPGETKTLLDIEGSGVIRHIWLTVGNPDKMHRRNMVIRMFWDGEEQPSVESPLGDFFGQGWGESYNFISLPLAVSPRDGRGLNSFWPMPFGTSAKIQVENQSEQPCDAFYFYVDYELHDRIDGDLGRFHAWWNRELTMPMHGDENEWELLRKEDKNPSDQENYLFVEAEGRGHYVGVNYYVDCPTPLWYGEGDDMFVIDGDPWPPALHGTGTEDYFNSCWSPKEKYSHPYFGYARVNDNIGWLGRTHCYRFHMEDPIHFAKSLRASIEHGHANCLTLDLCTVAYWYQTEPHKTFPVLPPKEKRQPMPEISHCEIHRWRHAWREWMGGGLLWGHEPLDERKK